MYQRVKTRQYHVSPPSIDQHTHVEPHTQKSYARNTQVWTRIYVFQNNHLAMKAWTWRSVLERLNLRCTRRPSWSTIYGVHAVVVRGRGVEEARAGQPHGTCTPNGTQRAALPIASSHDPQPPLLDLTCNVVLGWASSTSGSSPPASPPATTASAEASFALLWVVGAVRVVGSERGEHAWCVPSSSPPSSTSTRQTNTT